MNYRTIVASVLNLLLFFYYPAHYPLLLYGANLLFRWDFSSVAARQLRCNKNPPWWRVGVASHDAYASNHLDRTIPEVALAVQPKQSSLESFWVIAINGVHITFHIPQIISFHPKHSII